MANKWVLMTTNSNRYMPKGLIARIAIQCQHPQTGKTGCWAFSGQNHKDTDSIVSPFFSDYAEVVHWMNATGQWDAVGAAYVRK